jgi:hypothetical protein
VAVRERGGGTRYIRDMYVEFDGLHPWVVVTVEPPAGTGLLFDLLIDDDGPAFVVSDGRGHAEGAKLPPVRQVCEWVRLAVEKGYFMSRVVVINNGRVVMTGERLVQISGDEAADLVRWLTRPRTRNELIEP